MADYLRGPWALPAAGDADGIRTKVFPHLGIDCDAIRGSTVEGTFNLVDFVTKTCVAVPHTEVDPDLLAAGMSLPLAMPPLRRGDRVWTDAVWVKDANVTEALRRGADEVWLVWAIGNSPYWGDGPLEQYVHMIEMSANGALFAELDAARHAGRDFRLHVVRPRHPLPLDSELFAGRISASTLVDLGYRDCWEYLDTARPEGVPKDPTCTAMTEPPIGVRLTERLRGRLDGVDLTLTVTSELALDESPGGGPTRLVGHVDHAPWGGRLPLAEGRVEVEGPTVVHSGRVRVDGRWVALTARRELADDEGLDAWADVSTVTLSTSDGAGRRCASARWTRRGRWPRWSPSARTARSTGPARWRGWAGPGCAAFSRRTADDRGSRRWPGSREGPPGARARGGRRRAGAGDAAGRRARPGARSRPAGGG